jgi:hypothetical protein
MGGKHSLSKIAEIPSSHWEPQAAYPARIVLRLEVIIMCGVMWERQQYCPRMGRVIVRLILLPGLEVHQD